VPDAQKKPSSQGAPIASAINDWFTANKRDLPWRADGYPAWGILVSEIMLQQTPVVRVIPRLEQWLARWPTPAALAASPAGDAVRAWERLGYPRRALNLHAAAVAITRDHGGVVPDGVDELLALPGVGQYTARAVAAFAYGVRTPVVDTNVRRVLARAIDGDAEAGPASTTRDLAAMEAQLPADVAAVRTFNAGAMELGAVVCTARAPRCDDCPIAGLCAWRLAGYPPYAGARRAPQKKYEGSDRQVRGIILAALRDHPGAVAATELVALWPDGAQFGRALDGLLIDGLVVGSPETGYALPD
jgi:A/G-specific adenine glycosylase